jgi:glycosyltransferase involved in cell wall biosynthesis
MKISIITVCYNSATTIRDTIDSVLAQDYSDIEYIVIDGGSTDTTLNILGEYRNLISHLISEPDQGIYDAMNKGIALASGDVVGILNSDDFYHNSNVLKNIDNIFNNNPNIDMVLGNVDFVSLDDLENPMRLYSSVNFHPWKLRFGLMPAHPGAFIKKSAYNRVGKYKLGYKISADFDMFVRLLLINQCTFKKLNETLVRMRMGGISTSGFASNFFSTKEMLRSFDENNIYSNYFFISLRFLFKLSQFFKINK